MTTRKHWLALLLTLAISTESHAAEPDRPALLVYAAASLTNVLEELGKTYQDERNQAVKFSFAASSALARQIEAGAKADLFIGADTDWADYLQTRNLLKPESRFNLLGNRLVLIAPTSSTTKLSISSNFALSAALGNGRLSIGDPDSVPAGKYARAALTSLNVWNSVADKLVLGDSVRSTLAFVSRGEAPLGIVYATDAQIDKQVKVVDVFPDNTHPAIVYPIAMTVTAQATAAEYIAFLRSDAAQMVFRRYGFTVLK